MITDGYNLITKGENMNQLFMKIEMTMTIAFTLLVIGTVAYSIKLI